MSARCRGLNQGLGNDRRQALATLLGAGLAGATLAAPRQAWAGAAQLAPLPGDEHFMRIAIAEAARGDFPFGAVIVRDGDVLSTGRNLGRTTNDPTAHGEMVAIRRFVAVRPAAELQGTTLYTSGEPCPMCMSAILWCGIGRVVFAASIDELATKLGQIMLTSRAVADAAPFATIAITGGGPFRRGAGAVYGGSVTSGSATRFVGVYSGRMASCDPLDAQLGLAWPAARLAEIILAAKREV